MRLQFAGEQLSRLSLFVMTCNMIGHDIYDDAKLTRIHRKHNGIRTKSPTAPNVPIALINCTHRRTFPVDVIYSVVYEITMINSCCILWCWRLDRAVWDEMSLISNGFWKYNYLIRNERHNSQTISGVRIENCVNFAARKPAKTPEGRQSK